MNEEALLTRLDTIIEKLTAIEALLQPPPAQPKTDPVEEVQKARTASDLLRLMKKKAN